MFSGSELFSVKRLTLRRELVKEGVMPRLEY